MLDLDLVSLQETLKQLDLAIYWHEKWSANLTRTIVCRLPHDQFDVTEDAHRRCRFGQWYYGNEVKQLHGHQSFVAVEGDHVHMHQMARRLMLAIKQGTTDTSMEYDDFRNDIQRGMKSISTKTYNSYYFDTVVAVNRLITLTSNIYETVNLIHIRREALED